MYDLQLDDGTRWLLRPKAGTEEWLGRFASIMGLAMRAGSMPGRILTFYRAKSARPGRTPGFRIAPDHGGGVWDFRRLPGVSLRDGKPGQNVACILPNGGDAATGVETMRHLLLPLYLDVLGRGGFPVHAALVQRDGRGFLVAGRSGIGKSTCCRRLPPPWKGLADDLALVIRESSGGYRAHPLPTWSAVRSGRGGTCDAGYSVPLEAVFFLDQSGSDEAVPIGTGMAAAGCSQSIMQVLQSVGPINLSGDTRSVATRVFENAAAFSMAVPSYLLRVSLAGRFWEEIEAVLYGDGFTCPV